MKKILSTLLVAAMLLSMVIIVSVPAAAIDGEWTTYGPASEGAVDYTGDPTSVPGYEYTKDGLHVIPANWAEQVVYGTVQTKNLYNIEDGVYLELRVDKYDIYKEDGTVQDNWISFTLWDSKNVEPGQTIYGSGVMTLNRIGYDEEADKYYFGSVDWYTDGFTTKGQTCEKDENDKNIKKYLNEDGSFTMTLEIKAVGGAYQTFINGAAAPDSVNEYIATKFADGEAYIGVTYRHGNTGGEVDMTITKFGSSKEDAYTPDGTDRKEPVDNSSYHVKAPIADASTIPAGQPCFTLTGNLADSATKKFYGNQGGVGSVGDDFTMHIDAGASAWTSFIVDVKNDISYDIDDFPVMIMLTKDFCMCDDPTDCYAVESIAGHLMTGKEYAAGNNKFPELEICWEPIIVDEGDKAGQYLYFMYDFADDLLFTAEGRINSIRFDISGLKYQEAGRGTIDVVFVAFFRTTDEAVEYVLNYLDAEAVTEPTDDPADETTEAPAGNVTTEAKAEEKTEAKTEAKGENKGDDNVASSGCGSVIGASAAAVVALVALGGAVVLRKKED